MRALSLVALVAALVLQVSAQQPRLLPFQRFGVIADNVGRANLVTADLNGDGVAEVISCSEGAPFAVTRSGASTWKTSWMGPSINCAGVTVGDRDGDGGYEVLVATNDSPGKLAILDPRSLAPPKVTVTLPESQPAADVAIGNIDSDPGNEIIVVTSANAYVYNGATLGLKWSAPGYGGSKVLIGDVDGDGRNDVVVNGTSGWVLDGQSQSLKFGYFGGFGYSMAVGDVDADSKAEIVFSMTWQNNVMILNGDTLQTTSIIASSSSQWAQKVAIGDANADGNVEIITGNDQWGSIEGHRPSDGLLLWDIANPEHGVQGLGVGDVTGDGKLEVIWGAGATSSGTDALFIGDPVTETLKWQSLDLDSSFLSAAADIDNDGRTEYVVCALSSDSGYDGTHIEVFDALTGAFEGVILAGTANFHAGKMAIGQTDNDAALEIVLAGGMWYSSQFVVYDGVTHVREFESAAPPCCSSPNFISSTLTVTNIDGDSVDEIILGMSDSRVLVFNGASNIIQKSLTVSGNVGDVAVADLDSNGVKELIVGTSSTLYAYDTSSWTIPGQIALSSVSDVVAAPGYVAVRTGDGALRTYSGTNLTSGWTCTSGAIGTSSTTALAIGTASGSPSLFAGDSSGNVRLFPLTGATCPAFTTTAVSKTGIYNLTVADATNDGRPDLLIDTSFAAEIDLLGLASDTLGDVDGDTVAGANDLDAMTDFMMGSPGLAPTGDMNGDGRIGAEDAFQLIHEIHP